MENENIAIAMKVFEHFNNHEWAKMASLYSEPAEFNDPSFGTEPIMQSRQNIVDKYSQMQQAFPDLRDDVLQIYPSGDKHVIVEFVSSGTAPSGSKWKLPICTIFTTENGLITKDHTYYDQPKRSN